jgi:hypothetical protein
MDVAMLVDAVAHSGTRKLLAAAISKFVEIGRLISHETASVF